MKSMKFVEIVFALLLTICLAVIHPIESFSTRAYAADITYTAKTEDFEDYVAPPDNLFVSPDTRASVRYLKLRVLLGKTYRFSGYRDYIAEAKERVGYADYPFIHTWGIGFTGSYTNIVNLPIDNCYMLDFAHCSDSVCGSNCNNNIDNEVHHKNSIKNLNKIRNDIKDSNYDLFLTMVATPLCGVWDSHQTNILGVTYLFDNYTFITNGPSMDENVRVRLMQHEISHMFGCEDNKCTRGADCIMNGGYDGVSLYTKNVWCSACSRDFDVNAH